MVENRAAGRECKYVLVLEREGGSLIEFGRFGDGDDESYCLVSRCHTGYFCCTKHGQGTLGVH